MIRMFHSHTLLRPACALALAAVLRPLPTHALDPHPAQPFPIEPEGALTLRQALDLTAGHNPDVAVAAHVMLAAEGDALQAGAFPNPELELEIESFAGTGPRRGFDGAETTLRLTQPFELGGKRSRRHAAASAESRVARWDHKAARLDARRGAKQAFVDVLAAQDRLALADAALALAHEVRRAAAERVKAGKVPEIEETKAAVEVASAGIGRGKARRELEAARAQLAACWGSRAPHFAVAAGSLEAVKDLGPLEAHGAGSEQTPEAARWTDALAARRDALALAQAARIPDAALSVGVRRFEDDGTHAAVAGLALPLPLFDRNAGGIAAAQHGVAAAEQKQRAARLLAATSLAEIHGRLETARTEAVAIRDGLLPAAQKAFDAAQTGYRQGKFGFLEVLDAQRTLNNAKGRHVEALAAYHKAAADLERFTGTPLDTIGQ